MDKKTLVSFVDTRVATAIRLVVALAELAEYADRPELFADPPVMPLCTYRDVELANAILISRKFDGRQQAVSLRENGEFLCTVLVSYTAGVCNVSYQLEGDGSPVWYSKLVGV